MTSKPSKPSRHYSGVVVVSQLRAELDRLIQDLLAATETAARPGGWVPAVDVADAGNALVIQVEVAGLAPADLRVEIEGTTVRVKGKRRLTFPRPGRVRFHCLERQEGSFTRQVEIREPVDFGRATARLVDGLLIVELPRVEERRRRLVVLDIEEHGEEPRPSGPVREESAR